MCRFCDLLYTIRSKVYKVVRRFLRSFSALIDRGIHKKVKTGFQVNY